MVDARLRFERLSVDQEVRHRWPPVVLSVLRIRVPAYEVTPPNRFPSLLNKFALAAQQRGKMLGQYTGRGFALVNEAASL
jgi:hypothetical protein